MIHFLSVPSRPAGRGWGGRFLRRAPFILFAALVCGLTSVPLDHRAVAAVQPQALILDPFPAQHSPGYDGQDIATTLQTAGFQVTSLTGAQVTVPVMRQLSRYAVVYIFTHSGPLPNNDAAVSTGDTRHQKFRSYFNSSSLVLMHIMSDTGMKKYDAVTGRFILRYSGTFAPHSLIFLNACTALGMPLFWKELKKAGVGTLVSWHHHVTTADADRAAHEFFAALGTGQTVDEALHTLQADGAAMSIASSKTGTFGFSGQGKNTLKQIELSAAAAH